MTARVPLRCFKAHLDLDTGDMVTTSGVVYKDTPVMVDWKESPDEVIKQVNLYLRGRHVGFEFVLLDDGSDQYTFGVKELK